jgi:hypothetical protein
MRHVSETTGANLEDLYKVRKYQLEIDLTLKI